MQDEAGLPPKELLPPIFHGPGGEHRRSALEAYNKMVETLAVLVRKSGRPEEELETLRKTIDIHIARIATFNGFADSEDAAAANAAALKAANEMSQSSNALVFWTKVMVFAVIGQAVAAIATVIVMLCG